jgi:membrane-anchored protein YejM (alkaline phosphatase superfamily)
VNETRTNAWGHNSNFLQWQTKVPLLVFWPGKKPETHTHRTTHWDIVPTLMSDALGVPAPPRDYSSGKKLWDVSEPPFFIMASHSQTAILSDNTVVVLGRYAGLGVPCAFDHKTAVPRIPPKTIRDALMEMNRFHKPAALK